jgi:mannosyltransferase
MDPTSAGTGRVLPRDLLTRDRGADWVPWALAAAIAVGAAVRFATLGMQSYHHDEAWTAGVVLHKDLFKTLGEVGSTESTPPLYYVLAWGWSKFFGTGEWGLRSLSALFGLATIPVVYLIGRRLAGSRVGVAAAAFAAVNPALIWYSQEARAYSLLILLSALGFYFFLRARDGFEPRDLALWALFSGLAVATHYFGAIPAAVEAGLLLASRRDRAVLIAVGAVAAVGLALAPLAIHQADAGHADFIGRLGMPTRLGETAVTAVNGETGRFISQPLRARYAVPPLLLIAAALALLPWRATAREQRAAGLALAIAAASVLLTLGAAAVGVDYLLARNLLPALVPLLAAVAIGVAGRRSGRLGLCIGGALAAYWLAFALYVDLRPRLQRPDWRDAAAGLGPAAGPREIVASGQGSVPLRYYLEGRSIQVRDPRPALPVVEVDVVSVGEPPPRRGTGLPTAFRELGRQTHETVTVTRYRAPHPVPVPWEQLLDHYTGSFSRDVIAQGVAPAALGKTAAGVAPIATGYILRQATRIDRGSLRHG